jgi:hypothetical protein
MQCRLYMPQKHVLGFVSDDKNCAIAYHNDTSKPWPATNARNEPTAARPGYADKLNDLRYFPT